MKKFLISLISIWLLFVVVCFSACDGSGSLGGGNTSGAVYLTTEAYITKTIGGQETSTEKNYCGEDVFLYVKLLDAQNTSSEVQVVNMVITIDNAKYLDVEYESANDVDPIIREEEAFGSKSVTKIEGISFLINPNSTKRPMTYIFRLRPTNECEGKIKVSYTNSVIEEGATYTKKYTFYKRDFLDVLPTPIIHTNKDRLYWTVAVPEKGFLVQAFDSNGIQFYRTTTSANEVTLANLFAGEMIPGKYKLHVIACGDGQLTSDSQTASYEFIVQECPIVTVDDRGIISWTAIEGACGYEVSIDYTQTVVSKNFFDITKEYEGAPKNIKVSVLPLFKEKKILCTSSNMVVVKILPKPVIIVGAAKVSWTAVEGATAYDIYINGKYKETITATTYRKQIGENIMLTVVAKNGVGVISTHSEAVDISTD